MSRAPSNTGSGPTIADATNPRQNANNHTATTRTRASSRDSPSGPSIVSTPTPPPVDVSIVTAGADATYAAKGLPCTVMATAVEVTAAEHVAAALDALGDVDRFTGDTRAHLIAALKRDPIEPGTLAQAARVAGIVIARAQLAKELIRDAQAA